mmetsp:Transcript_20706/g.59367  ORF Transcript_20706/g.59367 Transcript_20706/m.59367 type:complete len:84 (-) Transcript_20706:1297-1548(-)
MNLPPAVRTDRPELSDESLLVVSADCPKNNTQLEKGPDNGTSNNYFLSMRHQWDRYHTYLKLKSARRRKTIEGALEASWRWAN